MKILMLLKSPLDNDSRVKKEIRTLLSLKHTIKLISVASQEKHSEFEHVVIEHKARRRILPGVSEMLLQLLLIIKAVKHSNDIDIIHCHDLNTLHIGVLVKLMSKRKKIIYDTHEYAINDIPNQSWMSIKIKYYLEKCLIRYADQVIVVSDSIANEYVKLYGIEKPNLVMNCPEYTFQDRKNIFREKFNIRPDQKIFLYQGNLGRGRGVEVLLQAFSERAIDNCVLVFMGYGVLKDLICSYESRSSIIFYHPVVSQKDLLDHTSSADIGLSLIEDTCMSYRYCLPNKMFEYIMGNLPVITSDLPEMRRIVESENIGLIVRDDTIQGIQAAINKIMLEDLTRYAGSLRGISRKYCWESQENVLANVYQKIGV